MVVWLAKGRGRKQKKPVTKESVHPVKTPHSPEDPGDYLNKTPSWRFARNKAHKYDRWKILNNTERVTSILDSLMGFEGLKWQEIKLASGGKRSGTNNHFIGKDELCKDAQEYMDQYQLDDQIFSLRISGKERLFGQIDNGVFVIHWYDENHEICPSTKRNT